MLVMRSMVVFISRSSLLGFFARFGQGWTQLLPFFGKSPHEEESWKVSEKHC